MKLHTRLAAAACLATTAALVAAGCGSGDSDSTTSSKALDFVPATALGYGTIDLDFEGDNWKQLGELSGAVSKDGIDVSKEAADIFDDADYEKDIEPWLGDKAGVAITKMTAKKGAKGKYDTEGFAWVEIKDGAKLKDFAEDEKYKESGSEGDFTLYEKGTGKDKEAIGVSDDLLISSDSVADVKRIVTFDGKSIEDASGLSDVTDEVKDDALAAIIINGAGLRDLLKEDDRLDPVANLDAVKDFKGVGIGVSAEDNGLRIHGTSVGGSDIKADKGSTELLQNMPETTLVAFGGNNLGGQLKGGLDALGKDEPKIQNGIAQIGSFLGADVDEIAEAIGGEFAFGMSGDDAGIQSLAGTLLGSALSGGSLKDIKPADVLKAGAFTLAFENNDETAATMDKVVGGVATLLRTKPTAGKAGEFQTKTISAMGLPVTIASSEDISAINLGTDVFTTWGDKRLGDNASFKDAWEAAGAPDDAVGAIWLDFGRVAKLVELPSKEGVEAGGIIGWGDVDGAKANFDLFFHIDTK